VIERIQEESEGILLTNLVKKQCNVPGYVEFGEF